LSEETVESALAREFLEETGIQVISSEPLMIVEHDYPDRHVRLHVHTITEFEGEVSALEGQQLKWISLEELNDLDFLQGNQVILDRLSKL